jgi:hypothetical protein
MRSPKFTGRLVGILIFISSFFITSLALLDFVTFVGLSDNITELLTKYNRYFLITSSLQFAILLIAVWSSFLIYHQIKGQSRSVASYYMYFAIAGGMSLLFLTFVDLHTYLYTRSIIGVFNQNPDSMKHTIEWTTKVNYYGSAFFSVTIITCGLLFCHSTFQSRIVPRFLSVWGFAGYICATLSLLITATDITLTNIMIVYLLYTPNLLWALIAFPLWLIIKGFNPPAPQPCKQAS